METEKLKLKTSDGVEIIGDFYRVGDKDAPAAALFHMIPATKESWKELAKSLNSAGFHCLAIDLRGHGESEGGPQGFKEFSDQQHQKSIMDAEAAIGYLFNIGIPMEKIAVAGASIGANLSLQIQAEHPEIKASVMLSPGLNYKGIETERITKELKEKQSIFLAAGGENDDYSTETIIKLYNAARSKNKKLKMYKNAGHGTDIFKEEPLLIDEITEWLKDIYF